MFSSGCKPVRRFDGHWLFLFCMAVAAFSGPVSMAETPPAQVLPPCECKVGEYDLVNLRNGKCRLLTCFPRTGPAVNPNARCEPWEESEYRRNEYCYERCKKDCDRYLDSIFGNKMGYSYCLNDCSNSCSSFRVTEIRGLWGQLGPLLECEPTAGRRAEGQ